MVDIRLEILGTSVPLHDLLQYKVKTWWCQIELDKNKRSIQIPQLPMIEHYLTMNGKDTSIFLETWMENVSATRTVEDGSKTPKLVFLGLSKCTVDEQLKVSNLNPTVQWLDVYDPIEDIVRGKVLLRVDARYSLEKHAGSYDMQTTATDDRSGRLTPKSVSSSYFSTCGNNNNVNTSTSSSDSKSQAVQTQTDISDATLDLPVRTDLKDDTYVITCEQEELLSRSLHRLKNVNHTAINRTFGQSGNTNHAAGDFVRPKSRYSDGNQVTKAHKILNSEKGKSEIPINSTETHKSSIVQKPTIQSEKSQSQRCDGPFSRSERSDSVENIIKLLNQNFDAVLGSTNKRSKVQKSDSEVIKRNYSKPPNVQTPAEISGRLAPEGRNETDSDFASIVSSPFKSAIFTGATQSTFSTNGPSTVENSKSQFQPPPRSRRIAAAIFND